MAKPKKKHPKKSKVWTEERWPTVNPNQPTKGQNLTPDSDPALTQRVRDEILARTSALADARLTAYQDEGLTDAETVEEFHAEELALVREKNESLHSAPIYKGKGKKRAVVGWKPKLTPAQQDAIHAATKPHAFTAEQVRAELS